MESIIINPDSRLIENTRTVHVVNVLNYIFREGLEKICFIKIRGNWNLIFEFPTFDYSSKVFVWNISDPSDTHKKMYSMG